MDQAQNCGSSLLTVKHAANLCNNFWDELTLIGEAILIKLGGNKPQVDQTTEGLGVEYEQVMELKVVEENKELIVIQERSASIQGKLET
jgi:hypothetical protein